MSKTQKHTQSVVYLLLVGFIFALFSGAQTVSAADGRYYYSRGSAGVATTTKHQRMLYAPPGGWTPSSGGTERWEQIWVTASLMAQATSDNAYVDKMLRQQIFIHPNGPDYQVKANDGYTGLYKDANGKIQFQVTGTLIPYRYFHTTSDNHRVSMLVKILDKDGKELDFRHYGTKLLPIDQTGRYPYRFTGSMEIKNQSNTAQVVNANGTPGNIQPNNYFQAHWNQWGGIYNLPRQVDKVCGLGIQGAYLDTAVAPWDNGVKCNYLYEWSGFQTNINVSEIIQYLDAQGHNTEDLRMDFKLVFEQTSPTGGINITTAPLDIVTYIGGSQAEYVDSQGKTGYVTINTEQGSKLFELKETSLLQQIITDSGVRSLTSSIFPRGTTHYNLYDRQLDTNGFPKRRNLKIRTLQENGGQRGIYFGWDLYNNGQHRYAPNDYFYVHNHTAFLRFTTTEIPSEVEDQTLMLHYKNIDAPSKYVDAIKPSIRELMVPLDSSIVTSLESTGVGKEVADPIVSGRTWKFTRSENPTYSRESYTVKSDTTGVYDVLRADNKSLTGLEFYFKRYDNVAVRYEDVHNRGTLVPVDGNPKTLEVAFNDTEVHNAEDELVDTNGVTWSFVTGVAGHPQRQELTNDALDGKELAPLVFYYEQYHDVSIEHRQIIRGSSPSTLDGINGQLLTTDSINTRVGRYVSIDAKNDGTLVDADGVTGYNYVGLISIDGGTTIRQHKTRRLETLVTADMDTIVFYYGVPVGCETTHANNIVDDTLVSCIEVNPSTANKKDFVLPYINGYLSKLGDITQYNAQRSVYVYNYAPIISPEGVYAIRNIQTRSIQGADIEESANDRTKIYMSPELNTVKVPSFIAMNDASDTNITLPVSESQNVVQMSDLYDPTFSGRDMSKWTDELSISYAVDNDKLNTTDGNVRFLLDYTYIDELRHNYMPTLVHEGRTYIAEYIASNLNYANQKAVRIDTTVEDAAVDYNEYMGTLDNTEYKYAVGFERLPVPKATRAAGEPWFDAVYERYYETFALNRDGYGSYDYNTDEFVGSDLETQQAIDISNRLHYHNDLNEVNLPYVDVTTRSDRTENSNTLTFRDEEMWYLIDEFDNNNEYLDNYGEDLENDPAAKQLLDDLITKPVNATYLPDLVDTHAFSHKKAIPLVYSNYVGGGNTRGQSFEIQTQDLFGVGSDSGLQFVSENTRTAPTPTTWQAGYKLKSDIFTSDANQLGRKVNRQAEYKDAVTAMGYTPVETDELITTKEGSLYYIPLHNGIGTTHRNRLLIGSLGLNDATLAQEDIVTYEKYLYGLGSDAIYTPQREEVVAGRKINKANVHYFLTGADTSLYESVDEWKVANGTRMMYTDIVEDLLN